MNELDLSNYLTIFVLSVTAVLAVVVLISLLFIKPQPDQIFITDKENLFVFNAKDVSSAHVERVPGGDHNIVLAQKYKHGYWVTKIPCESKERGSQIIGNISEVLSKT